jgi:hypothetical protein
MEMLVPFSGFKITMLGRAEKLYAGGHLHEWNNFFVRNCLECQRLY